MTDYVYVLGFTDGTLKVGRTSHPASRIGHHKYDAAMRGAKLNKSWVGRTSIPHEAERALIWVGRFDFPRAWGAEYFRADHAEFMSAVMRRMHQLGIHVEGKTCEASPFPRQRNVTFGFRDIARGLRVPVDFVRWSFERGDLEHDEDGRVWSHEITRWLKAQALEPVPA